MPPVHAPRQEEAEEEICSDICQENLLDNLERQQYIKIFHKKIHFNEEDSI